ncbi:MAG: AraC family transcriptional regulator ligand-binding domain-containing protein [Pseudomonadota bacterium]
MHKNRYISSAYLRLIEASYPAIKPAIQVYFDDQPSTDEDYIDGAITEALFPELERLGVNSLIMQFGSQLHLASHGPLGFAALSAPKLGDALYTLMEFSDIRSGLFDSTMEEDGDELHLFMQIDSDVPLVRRWLVELGFDVTRAVIETIMAHPIGSQGKVVFTHKKPAYARKLQDYLQVPLEFSGERNRLTIPASWADVISPLSNESSFHANIAECRELQFTLTKDKNSVARVNHLLEHFFDNQYAGQTDRSAPSSVAALPGITVIAQQMHMSSRTLTRKLQARGTSYQQLLDSVRSEYARRWLSSTHLTVAEIAHLLAYQEAANFTRAFKRWHACTPQDWRRSH